MMPAGTLIHNIELRPGQGGKLVRAAGATATLVKKGDDGYATVKLPSGEQRLVLARCYATVVGLQSLLHPRDPSLDTAWFGDSTLAPEACSPGFSSLCFRILLAPLRRGRAVEPRAREQGAGESGGQALAGRATHHARRGDEPRGSPARRRRGADLGGPPVVHSLVGLPVHVNIRLTRSVKAPGFNPLEEPM